MNYTEEELQRLLRDNPGLKISQMPYNQINQALDLAKRSGKYNAVKTEYRGIWYHSKKEALTANQLDIDKAHGLIDFWLRQVPFQLPGRIEYRADFVTYKRIGILGEWNLSNDSAFYVKVIEVKGMETDVWKLKHKLFTETYPHLELEIV